MKTANQPKLTTGKLGTQPLRAFIGIPIELSLAEAIYHYYQAALPTIFCPKNFRWTKLDNFHITLKFIAALDSALVETLAGQLGELVAEQACFNCQLKEPQWFPNKHKARLLVLSVSSGGILPALALRIDQLCQQWQIPKETKPFRPHLTLARLKQPIHGDQSLPATFIQAFDVNDIKLYQSTMDKEGSHYKALATFPLSQG
ncbi:RNA 2',3'-cyclic phosphodiesterase [Endozoicomonas sp. SM1973]|uniref:RNA 2',3'-cyclic phosphodiesterase n=1 Tax=Spartinivicinus marinus TaxID=2994442 RepID=A0A853I7B2_9GAMM|nr:RNA 2',3'-cyclic phosphodiesterase [Spartinivicinus marinus]MCX4025263.1 RNA 2',3'-cyclic phosphodiesterase [Spartinivicinus marinus]NYZ65984.1 RNA 2',3'-cyclic phosphodiesterase [Spartinivicinus marinus]